MTRQDSNATPSNLPEALVGKRQLGEKDVFCFGCHPGVPCFNTCCHDVNILLTPVDVLQLSRVTGLSTTDFVDRHTLKPITKELHLPVLILRMEEREGKPCPFLGEAGCTVYDNRPWACRMYPIGMGLPPARAGVEPEPVYFLMEDDFCRGREEQNDWTVETWRADQGIAAREDLEAGYRELVSHPWFIGGQRYLNPKGMELFFMAFFDLDTFRRFILESSFQKRFELDADFIASLRTDDEALLAFSSRWLRYALFQEPTMKVRDDAPEVQTK